MNKTQEATIKKLTKFTHTEIINMSDLEFYKNITKIFVKGIITSNQYKWLENQRLGETTQQVLNLMGGKVVGRNVPIGNCLKD